MIGELRVETEESLSQKKNWMEVIREYLIMYGVDKKMFRDREGLRKRMLRRNTSLKQDKRVD